MRTKIAIIGAGPAGLMLANLLPPKGTDAVIVENRHRDDIESRVRTRVLEQTTVDLLKQLGIGSREGLIHSGATQRSQEMDGFARKMQVAELNDIRGSRAAQTMLAENCVGLPLH